MTRRSADELLLATALIGGHPHSGILAWTDIAKHRDHCICIEASSWLQAAFLLELHQGLLRLRTDYTVNPAVVKARVS